MTNSIKQINSLIQIWLHFVTIKPSENHINIRTYNKLHNYLHPVYWLATDVSA